jgi:glutaredoxin
MALFKESILLIILSLALFACNAPRTNALQESSIYQTKNITTQLDEKALTESLAIHFSNYVNLRDKEKPNAKPVIINPVHFTIEQKQPVQLGCNTYFAVRITFKDAGFYNLAPPFPLKVVTDPTGMLLFNTVFDLRKSREAILSKSPTVNQIFFPDSISPATFLTGTGSKDVIFISDPFCGYCRKGYEFLTENLDSIRDIKIVHNPLSPETGSAVATWVMDYARENNIKTSEILEFSYSKLTPVNAEKHENQHPSPTEISINILEQYKKVFPELFEQTDNEVLPFYEMLIKKHATRMIKSQTIMKEAGFTSTPFFVINGKVIRGLDKESLEKALGIPTTGTEKTNVTSFCS